MTRLRRARNKDWRRYVALPAELVGGTVVLGGGGAFASQPPLVGISGSNFESLDGGCGERGPEGGS